MNKFKRFISFVLVVMLLLSACSGEKQTEKPTENTGQTTETKPTTEGETKLDPVTLKMYFIGEPGPDNEKVFKEISKKLKEKINAELEPAYLSWGDYLQRYPLLFSSGEDFDMIYTAAWALYAETASKGGFVELTQDMLQKYCPLTMKTLPKEAWDSTKINGKNYMIPHNNFWANHYGVIIRGDLRKKYGMPELKTFEDIEAFMQKVAENEPNMIPLDVSKNNCEIVMRTMVLYPIERYYISGQNTSVMTYDFTNSDKMDLQPFYEAPGFKDYIHKMREWNQKGYISKSDLTTSNAERFNAGKSAVKFDNIGNANAAWQLAKNDHPDWEIEYVNILENNKLGSSGFVGNGVGFNIRSKNIERAMMAADLLNYDPDLNFLINNGIPDEHSKLVNVLDVNGHKFKQIETIKPGAYGGISTWCFANEPVLPLESFEGYNELNASYFYDQIVYHPLDGFSFVTDGVTTEVANCSALVEEYIPILYLGFSDNPDKTLDEFLTKMKAGGMDKVNEELIKQAKEVFDSAKK